MILFPAIDLKNGQCVRLEQGDMARATVFNLDPAAQARSFAAQGFEYLHVVDLDGAFAGKPMNAANEADVLARADYGGPITAIVGKDTAIGTQFHPEKSQRFGLALIA